MIGLGGRDGPPWLSISRTRTEPATAISQALPRGATFGLAVAAGVVVAFSLPPFGWWPLGVLGLAGFAFLLGDTTSAGARAAVGAGVGLGQYVIGLWWVTEFNVAGYLALVVHGVACTALAAWLVPTRRRWGIVIGLPAALVAADWLRGHFPFGGLPLGGTALGQAAGPLVPAARLGGTLLVTGVTALAGAALAELARRRGSLRALVAIGLVVIIVAVGRVGPNGGPASAPLRVAVVQGGGPRGLHAVNTDPEVVFQRQLAASDALQPPLDLVLWPEDVLHVDRPVDQTPEGAQVAALARRLRTTVVVGVVEDVGADRFRNAAVAWGPEGTIVARYDKVHRVPFGEYVPGRSLVQHLANLNLVPRDAIPGQGPGLLLTPAGPLGVVISYEVFFEDRARAAIRAGGEVLLVPTNASSYRTSQVPTQEVAAAQLRAWETGRDTVQAAPTGYGALIDHDGQVRARTTLGAQQVLTGTVGRRNGRTVFDRLGDIPLLLLSLGGLLAASWRWRRPVAFFPSSMF
ncbi:MAG TPA: apolipoprotein N-acyltransferase [Acidimicrobiales bacterium]|nr:apolipoprotein N-acyltransferase [Acidimicrobiales bacterium]